MLPLSPTPILLFFLRWTVLRGRGFIPVLCHPSPGLAITLSPSSSFEGAPPAVTFSAYTVAALVAPLRFTLVGKFSHGRLPIDAVRKAIDAFCLSSPISIGVISPKLLLLRPSSEADFLCLRSKNIWFMANSPMRLFRWSPDFSADQESPVAPIWVTFLGLLNIYSPN
ncbi:putative glycine-rich cell wall structural protein 1 [Iris pallida]|uniref:Glycine-rich cell wall structural protein 1 n=1 Tax=Iris pallida TaxID=29817 RepID=A0AAX6E4P4_IRIPA|nr:putative glycine-rich cell wall structural protein 1 [Iris pallida]KAJ6806704.1 putative glycine-rich cell wall structural protein 1 [Iris pallida]